MGKNPGPVDVREEYANAFRTESYNDFWSLVSAAGNLSHTTSGDRLPSYRQFVEHLLEPDQTAAIAMLEKSPDSPATHTVLSNYFAATADAFLLYGSILKNIEQARVENSSRSLANPFEESSSALKLTKTKCSDLLRQTERRSRGVTAKLLVRSSFEKCSAVCMVALAVSLAVVAVSHGVPLLVAVSGWACGSLGLESRRKMRRQIGRLDAAAKGAYILINDLETTVRMVDRLNGEVAYSHRRGGIDTSAAAEQIYFSGGGFCRQLDDLEEHTYLCFMTINKARNLLVKEMT